MDIRTLASSSKGNCCWVSDGHTPLLIDCGLRYREIQVGIDFGVSRLAGVLLSHEHADHSRATRDLARVGVDIYTSQGTAEALGFDGHRLHVVRAREQFTLGTWTVLPFETIHDCAEPLGFLLANTAGEKLLFATDTAYIRYRFQGLTHILIECNYARDLLHESVMAGAVEPLVSQRIIRNHMSLATLLEMLKANDISQVRQIWLLHLSEHNSDAQRFRDEVECFTGKPTYVAAERGETA